MSAVIIISSFVIIFLKGSVFFETRYSEISFPISLSGKSSLTGSVLIEKLIPVISSSCFLLEDDDPKIILYFELLIKSIYYESS